ncbi:hypothetical protein L208DRAFT_1401919 [Tricholoma matsutake]|nr:hypothetical protein L208DRAFT_1401919 [Tricholoma matsutake 945]
MTRRSDGDTCSMIRTEIKELSHHQTYLSQTDTTCERFYVDTMGAASHTHTQGRGEISAVVGEAYARVD